MIVVLTELGYNGAVCQCDQFRIDLLDSSSKKRGVLDTWCTGDKGISAPLLTSICYERKVSAERVQNCKASRTLRPSGRPSVLMPWQISLLTANVGISSKSHSGRVEVREAEDFCWLYSRYNFTQRVLSMQL